MSYRRGMSNSIQRGFGFSLGWTAARFFLGLLSAVTAGIWVRTSRINPAARWAVRGLIIFVLAAGILVLVSEL